MAAFITDRVGLTILVVATLAGVWLGLAGPDTSPVAPPGSLPVPVLHALINFLFTAPDGGGGP
jgi:hypothetical protein